MWDYSLSIDVLGLVVEAVTGQSLGAFLEERLWGPLGMVDTSFAIPDNKKGRYALAFPNDPLTNKAADPCCTRGKPIKFECGGACAAGRPSTTCASAQMLLNGGALDGKRIVSRAMLEMMTSDQLGPEVRARTTARSSGEGYTFGLGFAVRQETGIAPVAGSKGDYTWGGAFGTYFWVDPKESWPSSSCRPRPAKSASTTAPASAASCCRRSPIDHPLALGLACTRTCSECPECHPRSRPSHPSSPKPRPWPRLSGIESASATSGWNPGHAPKRIPG